ncbi:hypothetical protein [Helicobacter sp. T3_23-1059]
MRKNPPPSPLVLREGEIQSLREFAILLKIANSWQSITLSY